MARVSCSFCCCFPFAEYSSFVFHGPGMEFWESDSDFCFGIGTGGGEEGAYLLAV